MDRLCVLGSHHPARGASVARGQEARRATPACRRKRSRCAAGSGRHAAQVDPSISLGTSHMSAAAPASLCSLRGGGSHPGGHDARVDADRVMADIEALGHDPAR